MQEDNSQIQKHITPLRIRSTSRDQKRGSMQISPSKDSFQEHERDTSYVSVRDRKSILFGNTLLNSHRIDYRSSSRLQLPNSHLTEDDMQTLMSTIKVEQQKFVNNELVFALNDFKNSIFEQQYGFERQIYTLIAQITKDLENKPTSPSPVDTSDFASKSDLMETQDNLMKLYDHLEGALRSQQSHISSQISTQQSLNDLLQNDLKNQTEQQRQINQSNLDQFKIIASTIQQLNDKLLSQEGKVDKLHYNIDNYKNDYELYSKTIKNDLESKFTQLQRSLSTVTTQSKDYDLINTKEHQQFRDRLASLEAKSNLDLTAERLHELEDLIRKNDHYEIIDELVRRINEVDQELQRHKEYELMEHGRIEKSHKEAQQQIRGTLQQQTVQIEKLVKECDINRRQIDESLIRHNTLANSVDDKLQKLHSQIQIYQEDFQNDQIRQDDNINEVSSALSSLQQLLENLQSQLLGYHKQDTTTISDQEYQRLKDQVTQLQTKQKEYSQKVLDLNSNLEKHKIEHTQSDIHLTAKVKTLNDSQLESSSFSVQKFEEIEERLLTLEQTQDTHRQETNEQLDMIDTILNDLKQQHMIKTQHIQNEYSTVKSQQIDQVKSYLIKEIENLKNQMNQQQQGNRDSFEKILIKEKSQDVLLLSINEDIHTLKIKELEQDERLDRLEEVFGIHEEKFVEVDNMFKQNKLEYSNQLTELAQHLISDQEFLENKIIGALQNDTIKLIQRKDIKPLRSKLTAIEALLRSIQEKLNQQPVVIEESIIEEHPVNQEHLLLLQEMRRKRLWYLRKTPQDYIIEDIMKRYNCTQDEAERFYISELEKNKKVRSTEGSPERGVNGTHDQNSMIKSIYDNIVHAIAPSRADNKSKEREGSGQRNEQPYRRPVNPTNQNEYIEIDEEESRRISPSRNHKVAPNYIVVKSPLHNDLIGHDIVVKPRLPSNNTRNQDSILDDANVEAEELDNNQQSMRDNMMRWNQRGTFERFKPDFDQASKNGSSFKSGSNNFRQSPTKSTPARGSYYQQQQPVQLLRVNDYEMNSHTKLYEERKLPQKSLPVSRDNSLQNRTQWKNNTSSKKPVAELQAVDEVWGSGDNNADFEFAPGTTQHFSPGHVKFAYEDEPYIRDQEFEGSQLYDYKEDIMRPSNFSQDYRKPRYQSHKQAKDVHFERANESGEFDYV